MGKAKTRLQHLATAAAINLKDTVYQFQRMVEARVNEEDFQEEEDLMAWKFAQEGADYWRHKSEELAHAAGLGAAVSGADSSG